MCCMRRNCNGMNMLFLANLISSKFLVCVAGPSNTNNMGQSVEGLANIRKWLNQTGTKISFCTQPDR